MIGDIFCVPYSTRAIGERNTFMSVGEVKMPKLSTDVIGIGKAVGWDAANEEVTIVAAAGVFLIGHAIEAAAASTTTVRVQFAPTDELLV